MLFKIGYFAYQIKSKIEKREYLGYYREFGRTDFSDFLATFPVPFTYGSEDPEIIFLEERRMLFVKLFWGVFFFNILYAFLYEMLFVY